MTSGDVGGEKLIGGLGNCPWEFLEMQAIVNDTTSPDVDQSGIVCYRRWLKIEFFYGMEILLTFTEELLWGDVRLATT